MASINTNDFYVKQYCKDRPQAQAMLRELVALKKDMLYKYGEPKNGGIEKISLDMAPKAWFQKVTAVQLDLLRELKRVCDQNGLRLFLVYGSLLGAARSGGMIDGDDDIDVALMRQDYDKFANLCDQFKPPYFLQNNYNDDCFYGGYMKFRNAETTAINPQNWYVDCCEGIFLDVFPIDSTFESAIKEKFKLWKIRQLQRLLFAKSYGFFGSFRDMPLLVWKAYKYFGKLFSREKLLRLFDKTCGGGDRGSETLAIYTHYGDSNSAKYIPSYAYADVCKMSYEGMEFLAPRAWDQVLSCFYGKDYLVPSAPDFCLHAFYKADVPYKEYKERFTALFKRVPNKSKKLVLFGDQELFVEYKKRFPGVPYRPCSEIALGQSSKLKELDVGSTYIVIAAFDFLDAENTVRGFGINDYSFYVYNREWMSFMNLSASKAAYIEEKADKGALTKRLK